MSRRETAFVTVALALLLLLAGWSLRGPSPAGETAPAGEFSAARAISVLRTLLAEERPHPVGTGANRVVRDRIVARLAALGYKAQIQRDFVCNATPACATVENIVAALPGDPGPYVLLASHYDSVAAGPGASDAGVPVAAILEVARALRDTRGVAYLITDGEEAGLLGAEAFVKRPMKERVSVVLNAENRGTSGPAFLFETSRGNAGLMPAIRAIERPYASSLFYTIYETLPNDTDATVFKRAGMQVLNFAAIGNVASYHTPLDDLARVSERTVQHHGDNLLSATRALLRGTRRSEANAVFFDLFGLTLVWWPERWTLIMAIASLVALSWSARSRHSERSEGRASRPDTAQWWRGVVAGLAVVGLSIVIAALTAAALTWVAHVRAGGAGRIAYPAAVIAAMWLAGLAGAFLSFSLARRSERRSVHAGAGVAWHLAAIALAVLMPGPSYLFLVPAVAFTVSLRLRPFLAAIVTAGVSAIVLFPLVLFLYPALGGTALLPAAILIALLASTFGAFVDRRLLLRAAAAMAVAALVLAAATTVLPVYTDDHRRRDPIEHELAAPTFDATSTRSGGVATIRVRSRRQADRVMLDFEEKAEVLRVNGVAPAPPGRRQVRRGAVTVYGPEAVVEVRVPEGTSVAIRDITYGLPPEARERAAARDAANGIASHRGDVTVSRVKIRI